MKRNLFVFLLLLLSLNLYSQVHWTKHPDNPVMVATEEWEGDYVLPRSVIYHDSIYHMWYWGATDNNFGYEAIGYAISPDGINWTKDTNNPVLEPGPEGAWDDHLIHGCSVILHDSIFHMWYNGHSGQDIEKNWGIGYATSPDGINWSKDTNNPVMVQGQVGEWDELEIELNSVIHDGDNFQMWYDGIGYNGGQWCVRAGHAISPDGVNWMEDSLNPILIPEYNWEGKMVFFLNTVYDGFNYKMWYAGGSGYNWQVGYATSDDGSVCEKYGHNPVLRKGPAGSWDQKHVGAGPVIDSAGVKYKMWYIGGQTDNSQRIGYAESSIFVEIPDTAFLHALIEDGVDTDEDGKISYAEAEAVTHISVEGPLDEPGTITDITGIEAFVNLEHFNCGFNQLTSIDVSNNTALTKLVCRYNQLTSLDVTKNIHLYRDYGFSPYGLDCSGNLLTTLDVSNNTSLKSLNCSYNALTTLNVSNNTGLDALICSGNQLTSLDVTNNIELGTLICSGNQLTSLDVSENTKIWDLDCRSNQLISLNLSNFPDLYRLNISDNPTLQEVCVWETFTTDSADIEILDEGSPNYWFDTICDGNFPDGFEETVLKDIYIFPNPTNSFLTIEVEQPDHHSIEIISLSGQVIYRTEMDGTSKQIDLTPFSKGVYFITVRSDAWVRTEKMVKY